MDPLRVDEQLTAVVGGEGTVAHAAAGGLVLDGLHGLHDLAPLDDILAVVLVVVVLVIGGRALGILAVPSAEFRIIIEVSLSILAMKIILEEAACKPK